MAQLFKRSQRSSRDRQRRSTQPGSPNTYWLLALSLLPTVPRLDRRLHRRDGELRRRHDRDHLPAARRLHVRDREDKNSAAGFPVLLALPSSWVMLSRMLASCSVLERPRTDHDGLRRHRTGLPGHGTLSTVIKRDRRAGQVLLSAPSWCSWPASPTSGAVERVD